MIHQRLREATGRNLHLNPWQFNHGRVIEDVSPKPRGLVLSTSAHPSVQVAPGITVAGRDNGNGSSLSFSGGPAAHLSDAVPMKELKRLAMEAWVSMQEEYVGQGELPLLGREITRVTVSLTCLV
ncbi:hypothetical protein DFH09DRAFT_1092237 [Mycena vulgaris]|nr:hypothetical protein DFH09DRAFT_1092237 [Mycena vulgaris]